MKRRPLSRRALLRGAGVAIGLPLLDAMLDSRGLLAGIARADAAPEPLYLLNLLLPNGTYTIDWYPAAEGDGFALTPKVQHQTNWLEPLAPHRADLMILSGLPKQQADLNKDLAEDAHARGSATFATAEAVTATGAGSASIDQLAAEVLGQKTKFKSVSAAIGSVDDPHWSYSAWSGKNQPVSAYRDPMRLWNDLFKDFNLPPPDPSVPPPPDYRKSVLDYVQTDLQDLQKQLGSEDTARVDAHLSAIRELEKQVVRTTTEEEPPPVQEQTACQKPDAPATTGAMSNERVRLMLSLQVMAFACDLTHVASFQMGNRTDERVFSWLGMTEGHHTISHDYTPEGEVKREKIWRDEIEQFAWLLQTMKDIRVAPDKTLLDRSLVFLANEHGQSMEDGHYMGDMPVIVAGHANGKLKTNQHIRFNKGGVQYSYSDLLLTLLNVLGVTTTSLGPYGKTLLPGVTV